MRPKIFSQFLQKTSNENGFASSHFSSIHLSKSLPLILLVGFFIGTCLVTRVFVGRHVKCAHCHILDIKLFFTWLPTRHFFMNRDSLVLEGLHLGLELSH